MANRTKNGTRESYEDLRDRRVLAQATALAEELQKKVSLLVKFLHDEELHQATKKRPHHA